MTSTQVATLAILGSPSVGADPLLYSLVFGESVLNDAIAIVLFNTFRGVCLAPTHRTSTPSTYVSIR